MHRALRSVAAAAAALVLLLAAPGRAELSSLKAKRAFLAAADNSVVATFEEPGILFAEGVELKGKGGCLLVRYSSEVIGTDLDQDGVVLASFDLTVEGVDVGPVPIEPFPNLHQATTNLFPQIVSFSAFACDLPPQRYNVILQVQPIAEDDRVATIFRTLEIWVEKGKRSELIQ